jgi:hypothetical protein
VISFSLALAMDFNIPVLGIVYRTLLGSGFSQAVV